jgi:hypothetical protein
MSNVPFPIEDVVIGEHPSLIAVAKNGSTYTEFDVKMSDEVETYLLGAWEATKAVIERSVKVEYTPETVVKRAEDRVVFTNDDLRDETDAVAHILDLGGRAQVSPARISTESLNYYALVGDVAGIGRVAMIRKTNPVKRASSGKMWALAGGELKAFGEDPWQLYPEFDVVLSDSGCYATNTTAFEQLFTGSEQVVLNVGSWVASINAAIPMTAPTRDLLIERCERNAGLRRRLRAIDSRGHLESASIDDVTGYLDQVGLPVATFVSGGELAIEQEATAELLNVLNEDIFTGAISGARFRSSSKEPIRDV